MGFDVDFLNKIRADELIQYLKYFPAGSRILEIGGGTGVQAKLLSEMGFDIISIDLPNSTYSNDLAYEVIPYDGHTLPLEDNSVDIVFSSNVLEHIPHIEEFHQEMKRVLRPGGLGIHAMPTGCWTFWTIITHYLNALQNVNGRAKINYMKEHGIEPAKLKLYKLTYEEARRTFKHMRKYMPEQTFPNRHGEFGNVFTELWTFSRFAWKKHFKKNDYKVISVKSMKLFYTGYMHFGSGWSIKFRHFISNFLGSACVIYIVKNKKENKEGL